MAAPVLKAGHDAIGVISIAGPRVRLTPARMLELGPQLLATAAELAASSSASAMFKKQPFHGRA